MLLNYIKLALRNMAKHRLYAAINILGLAIGLAVFLFGNLLARYEYNHDAGFSERDRIFTVGSIVSPDAELGILELDSAYTAVAPLLAAELGQDLEAIARSVNREFLVSEGDNDFYQQMTFAEAPLTRIFDFEYLAGDGSVLAQPDALILSRSVAEKIFGHTDVVGRTLTLDHSTDLHVGAVIEDLPKDSHFRSRLLGDDVEVFAPLAALEAISDADFDSNWGNLSMGELTYILLAPQRDQQWLQAAVNQVYQKHAPRDQQEFITGLRVRPLVEANTSIWDMMGLPAIESVRLLGLLVLIIACVNYTNLATAQSFGRGREVGLRKTFGASQRQLLLQFMVESLTTAAIAMLLALACLEVVIPLFNQATDKAMSLNYLQVTPLLLLCTLLVGTLAGAYPAWLITRATPVDSLKSSVLQGRAGNRFRGAMIGLQFALSIFMLAMVMLVYFQNQMVQKASRVFPRDEVVLLDRVSVEQVRERHPLLRQELLQIPGVRSMTYSSQVPFEQSNSASEVSLTEGDSSSSIVMNRVAIDDDFLKTYDIPLLAGRAPTRRIAGDVFSSDSGGQVNVVVNELLLQSLGLGSPESALGERFFDVVDSDAEADPDAPRRQYTIVGVMADRNFLGLHNKIKPMAFLINDGGPGTLPNRMASLRVDTRDLQGTLQQIERVWQEVNPDFPIQQSFLDDAFSDVYNVFRTINGVLAGFAGVALALALIGLFGLAAFMAERRTREIGIRKVLGARTHQIVRLLVWQFSLPVLWSLLVAIPLAWLASGVYLNFFQERTDMLSLIILLAAITGLVAAWLIVAGHAFKVARATPIRALRYE